MTSAQDLFGHGGINGALCAGLDWSRTPLGPVEGWSSSLRATVRTLMSSRYPMLLLWGPDYTQVYNDAYSQLIGDKHPAALGLDVRITLAEGWDVLEPLIEDARRTGTASWVPALQLLLERSGYREEAYFSVSHSRVFDDDGSVGGMLTVCSEVTEQVVGERRLLLLQDLALRTGEAVPEQGSVERTCVELVDAIADAPLDVPLVAAYAPSPDGRTLHRLASASAAPVELPEQVVLGEDDPWRLTAALQGRTQVVGDVGALVRLPAGAFGDPLTTALAVPLAPSRHGALGVLLLGASPSRGLDAAYRSFFDLLANQASVAVRTAKAYEDERARAEALAELDRAKTTFFTNVSHEFRTPLTLMLGPLDDALQDEADPLPERQQDRVEIAVRNAQRLLRLVNSLLDVAQVEGGALEPDRRVDDLAGYTAELASTFRAAVERAGLRYEVDCPPLPRSVPVDPEMWEKVVVNLLSNALKFTFVGGISVALRPGADGVELVVADTGIGIRAQDQDRLFERFHRVQDASARTHEGSGIGLSLVQQLAELHGGTVRLESEPGRGSTFTVALPWSDAVTTGSTAASTGRLVEQARDEALQWLGETRSVVEADGPRILVADDNADMRAYLTRLLGEGGYRVEAVADGDAALAAVRREQPDLLLSDVMMPGLDGFELLRTLRADAGTRRLPVVLLSARAGQEAAVEGLDIGADDYLVKPFSAAELLARVRSNLALARLRAEHAAAVQGLVDAASVISSGRALEDAVALLTEQARQLLAGAGAVTVLPRGADATEVRVATSPDVDPAAPGAVRAELPGRPDQAPGEVVVVPAPGTQLRADRVDLLAPVAQMLDALTQSAWRLAAEQRVAHTLQRSLLPEALPEVEGVELAARYLSGTPDIEVGGDWYDVVPRADGRLVLVIGDVMGRGLAAAAAMGQLRSAARAYALQDLDPGELLDRLAAVAERFEDGRLATVLCARLDPWTGALVVASAGHPPALLLSPDGEGDWCEHGLSAPLGAPNPAPRPQAESVLPPCGTVLLYTDGLVEDRTRPVDHGLALLAETASAAAGSDLDALVQAVLDGTGAGSRVDDVAVLAVRRSALPPGGLELELPAEMSSLARMRRQLRPALRTAGADDDAVFELLVAATEAAANAVEHAQSPTRPYFVVGVRAEEDSLSIEVRDFGTWRERRASMDRGRGSTLMSTYADVAVLPGPDGTRVTLRRAVGRG